MYLESQSSNRMIQKDEKNVKKEMIFEGGQQSALYIESTKEPEGTLNEQIK